MRYNIEWDGESYVAKYEGERYSTGKGSTPEDALKELLATVAAVRDEYGGPGEDFEKDYGKQKRAYEQDVISSAESNHMWVNAFTLISPSEETITAMGRWVLNTWNQRENRIKSPLFRGEGTMAGDVLILRFNAS